MQAVNWAVSQPPPAETVRLFGCSGSPVQLAGGEGTAWRVDSTVLKRVEPANADYEAQLIRSLPQVGYRLAEPVQSSSGSWTLDGWAAYTIVSGQFHKGENVEERFAASRLFHQELRTAPYSPHLDEQLDPWSVAQRVAFGKQAWEASPRLAGIWDSLRDLDHAPRNSWQVSHADISGNFLFEKGLHPAIIDLTLKWSPTGFAEAVMAVDIALWEGVQLEYVLQILSPGEAELIPLAAIRRVLEIDTLHRVGGRPISIYGQVARYEDFVDLYSALTKG